MLYIEGMSDLLLIGVFFIIGFLTAFFIFYTDDTDINDDEDDIEEL